MVNNNPLSVTHPVAYPFIGSAFLPSNNGFAFVNSFVYPIMLPVPLVAAKKLQVGLCGGMCRLAAHAYITNRRLPQQQLAPKPGTSLYQRLIHQQNRSYGNKAEHLFTFLRWWLQLNNGVLRQKSLNEWSLIEQYLQQNKLLNLGVVYVSIKNGKLWQNHQVLAYGYQPISGSEARVFIYDPNFPLNNTAYIHIELMNKQDINIMQFVNGKPYKSVRGFFTLEIF